jgi:hypothetical protein
VAKSNTLVLTHLFTFDRAISAAQDSSQTSWIIFVVTLVLLVSKFWLFKVGFFHTDVLMQGILTEGEGYIPLMSLY